MYISPKTKNIWLWACALNSTAHNHEFTEFYTDALRGVNANESTIF